MEQAIVEARWKIWVVRMLYVSIPAVVFLAVLWLRQPLLSFAGQLPACWFQRHWGVSCPSCGITRSMVSLLHGDLIASVQFHILPVAVGLIGLLWYLEGACLLFGKRLSLVPRSLPVWVTLLSILTLYFILRMIW